MAFLFEALEKDADLHEGKAPPNRRQVVRNRVTTYTSLDLQHDLPPLARDEVFVAGDLVEAPPPMSQYRAPLRDMQFVLHDLLDYSSHYAAAGFDGVARDDVDAILHEAAKFIENELAPLRRVGDENPASIDKGVVTLPPGVQEAYDATVEAGWPSMSGSEQYDGQGLPASLSMLFREMVCGANPSFLHTLTLTSGAVHAIEAHADDALKQAYLPKLIAGEWTGTMCLTEPQAGSDLGILNSKAVSHTDDDGTYAVSGNKIFITYGEHDLVENIIHLVLARLPDAPAGPRGISLFLVPKVLPDGSRNSLVASAIEHKMGTHGTPTCVMDFDDAKGWLVGKPHGGLAAMFTMMNSARLEVGTEGLGAAELSLQLSTAYARERLQMRSPTGAKHPEKMADPIIVHPDVRRMLLTQKAFAEGCRALTYYVAQQLDGSLGYEGEARAEAADLIALLTPINKAFNTDRGLECASLALQTHGGHGYIRETGVEQIYRDARIAPIYEGTNGIQANDLIGRKILRSEGRLLRRLTDQILRFCEEHAGHDDAAPWIEQLSARTRQWLELTDELIAKSKDDPEAASAAATDYLELSGYICLAWMWARMVVAAGGKDDDFHRAKRMTARFYFERILPRVDLHAALVQAGARNLMEMPEELFVL